MGQYEHHIFVCTTGKTCAAAGSCAIYDRMKDAVKEKGLRGRVRVNQAGCMNQCGHGPMVVVYPADVWYAAVDKKGADRIIDEHVIGGTPVRSLRYIAPPGDNKTKKD